VSGSPARAREPEAPDTIPLMTTPQPLTYAVTAVGPDAPGEVAGLAEALAGLGANLEDASMTRLRGHFAMTLVASVAATAEEVEQALAAAGTGLHVSVWDVTQDPEAPAVGSPHRVTLHGADRPGLVATVTRALATHGGNITDLTCRLAGDLYVMTLEVDLVDPAPVEEALREVSARLDVHVRLEPVDEDVL
jgi:glycine cleavage system transcriptional repressor